MSYLHVTDYREEFHLKTFRRWYVITELANNVKFKNGVPLKKAALVDFFLCNPFILQSVLIKFGKIEPILNLDELLYNDNLEFGQASDIYDFSRTAVLLISKGYIGFKKSSEGILLFGKEFNFDIEDSLLNRWKMEISALQSILGKSTNVLTNAVYGEIDGN